MKMIRKEQITKPIRKIFLPPELTLTRRGVTILWDDIKSLTGVKIPWWLGFCWFRHYDATQILAPIPLNLLLRLAHKLWWYIKIGSWSYSGFSKMDIAIRNSALKHKTQIIADYLKEKQWRN